MAHDGEKRREARKRFVYEKQPLAAIATFIGLPETTLYRWKREAKAKGDDWDMARSANTVAGEGLDRLILELVQDYVTLHQATIEDIKSAEGLTPMDKAKALSGLADSFNKTVAAAGRVSPKISELGVAMDVLKRLADYVARAHPDVAGALLEVIEPFGATLTEVYG